MGLFAEFSMHIIHSFFSQGHRHDRIRDTSHTYLPEEEKLQKSQLTKKVVASSFKALIELNTAYLNCL